MRSRCPRCLTPLKPAFDGRATCPLFAGCGIPGGFEVSWRVHGSPTARHRWKRPARLALVAHAPTVRNENAPVRAVSRLAGRVPRGASGDSGRPGSLRAEAH